MKDKINKAITNTLNLTKNYDKETVYDFLEYLSTYQLNSMLSETAITNIIDVIRSGKQETIMDFLYNFYTNLIYEFGNADYVNDIYTDIKKQHEGFINVYENSDNTYYKHLKESDSQSENIKLALYLLRHNIVKINNVVV